MARNSRAVEVSLNVKVLRSLEAMGRSKLCPASKLMSKSAREMEYLKDPGLNVSLRTRPTLAIVARRP